MNTILRAAPAALLTVLLSLLSCADAGGPEDASHVIRFTTTNGLRVEMLPSPGSGLVASNVFVGAGSTRETDDTAGSSHFLEHLLFNGTTSRTQEELYAEVERIGAYNNATTRQDYTHFMMVAPVEELESALDIQTDMLFHSTLPEEKFEKERGIVLEELRKDQDRIQYRLERLLAETFLGEGDPYRRPVLGTAETIAALDRSDVLRYYQRQYVPSNMRLLVMGEFDPETLRPLLEEKFRSERQDEPAPAPRRIPVAVNTIHRRPFEDESMTYTLRFPAPGAESPDLGPFLVLEHLLTEGSNSRIQSALSEAGLEAQEMGASLRHFEGASLLELQGSFEPGTDARAVTEVILGELATVAELGVHASEWSTARTALLSSSIRHLAQLHYYALFEGDRVWHAGASREEELQNEIETSHPRMRAVAERWLGEPQVEIAVVGPRQEVDDLGFDLREWGHVPSDDETEPATLPGGGQLDDTRPVVAAPQPPSVTRLENGMTVIHSAVPTTRMFAMHLWVRDRSAREPAEHEGMADLLHRCLGEGAGNYDAEEFDALVSRMGAELKLTDSDWIPYDDYYTTPEFSFVRLDCVDLYWREAIRILALMIQEPRLDDSSIEEKKAEMARRRAQDAGRSSAVSARVYDEAVYGEHPYARRVFGTEESLEGVGPRDLQRFALDYLDPGQLILAVVGNLDRDAVLEQLRARFASGVAADHASAEVGPLPVTTASQRRVLEVGGRQSSLRMGRIVEVAPEDAPALRAATRILSRRMQQELREERGLAYSLGISVRIEGDRAHVEASIGTQPVNLEEAETAVRSYLQSPPSELEEGELEAAVNGSLGRQRMRQVTQLGQAYTLCRDLARDDSLDRTREEAAALIALEETEVLDALARYFGEGPLVTVVAR